MIEFTNTTREHLMYFAGDGSWGDGSDIVIVDTTELDGHYVDMMDELGDYYRSDFMRWYVDNQGHDQRQGEYTACEVCELWENGTEDEIIADLDSEEE